MMWFYCDKFRVVKEVLHEVAIGISHRDRDLYGISPW